MTEPSWNKCVIWRDPVGPDWYHVGTRSAFKEGHTDHTSMHNDDFVELFGVDVKDYVDTLTPGDPITVEIAVRVPGDTE
ncbi:hypothetical protein LCGC14_1599430 [marine sediment metagenome]|uniref:Uncharacterized protein n=1 Tax=marine sediment metagenome TaxID=412755 RepID=A0A0F9IBN1_9ZZZZ